MIMVIFGLIEGPKRGPKGVNLGVKRPPKGVKLGSNWGHLRGPKGLKRWVLLLGQVLVEES